MTTTSPPAPRVVVVGAGIAGLVCALELESRGFDVLVLERELEVGGRVRSRRVDGFTIDRGFQVLFTAYPVLRDHLDLPALEPRPFLPGARLPAEGGGGDAGLVGDALRHPGLLLQTLRAAQLPLADKLRLLALRHHVLARREEELLSPPYTEISALDYLHRRGFSAETLLRFFIPFYGGILLDRTLGTRASVLLFTFRMLASGQAVLPAAGMGAIPAQLAARLDTQAVRTGTEVVAVLADGARARGVRVRPTHGGGETDIQSDHVVLATEPPVLARLAATADVGAPVPDAALGSTTLHFRAVEPPLPGRAIWLNPEPDATVLHAVTLSEVAGEYAPPGQHLLSATAVGETASRDDAALERGARADLARMHGGALPVLELLAIERVPYAQYAQPPGAPVLRGPQTTLPNLWLASEALHFSSLEGAARGGRDAALALLASVGGR